MRRYGFAVGVVMFGYGRCRILLCVLVYFLGDNGLI